ncbi:hypothetical protein B0J11DRAFT_285406 [Dendryphion nanum]|uniref:Uncharacterized protein n=1 Tax=Dendryphion nanum TaxID=256645 RepID=A0A9P9IPP0_9PLEO|nr:hypothetical protein B0J11DRAFT_285406 [Dendryphion nanum]
MASIISQPGLGLTAPSSRQDIISALLNDYGNSFGADTSPYSSYSPNPALKELPPPPPKDDGKPLSGLMMRFQLRVDEPQSPFSPFEERKASPTKIVYRSMSRNSKPPSLKLLKSNGATAIIPQSQAPPAPAKDIYSSLNSIQDRPLPPPPPPKSERRQSSMGNGTSKPERRDSKDPQDSRSIDSSASVSVPPVKRKPVPAAKGFSLADLGAGPRGRKPVANEQDNPRRPSVARSENETPAPRAPSANRANLSKQELPAPPIHQDKAEAPLPPPPPEKEQLTLPPAPRKALGLPSNPRAKGQDTSMSSKHIRGKSSTGLDIMKVYTYLSPPKPAHLNHSRQRCKQYIF